MQTPVSSIKVIGTFYPATILTSASKQYTVTFYTGTGTIMAFNGNHEVHNSYKDCTSMEYTCMSLLCSIS